MECRSDINCAVAASTLPSFALEIPESDVNRSLPSRILRRNVDEYVQMLLTSDSLIEDLRYTIMDMKYLTQFIGTPSHGPGSGMDRLWFSDSVYLVQRKLIFSQEGFRFKQQQIWIAVCLASQIYIECFLRSVSRNAATVRLGVTRLLSCLNDISSITVLESLDEQSWKLYFWALFIGGTSTLDNCQQELFVSHAVSCCRSAPIKATSENFRTILFNLAWPASDVGSVSCTFEEKLMRRLNKRVT